MNELLLKQILINQLAIINFLAAKEHVLPKFMYEVKATTENILKETV